MTCKTKVVAEQLRVYFMRKSALSQLLARFFALQEVLLMSSCFNLAESSSRATVASKLEIQ